MDPPLFTSYSLPHPVPSVPSIVPEMLEQEFEDTPEEREAARVRSEQIDAELASEAISRARRRQEEVHVLLLGQSGAGKSTLHKQFQLLCKPESMEQERASWRGVIFMNVIKSLREIFDVLGAEDQLDRHTLAASPASDDGFGNASIAPPVSSHLLNIRYRLMPLLSMEGELIQRLRAGYINDQNTGEQHIYVRHGWQTIQPEPSSLKRRSSVSEARASLEEDDVIHDVSTILMSCKDDIASLWGLPDTQQSLKRRKLQLSEAASLFLRDLDRISDPLWRPSDEDILFARVKTVGVETTLFEIPAAKGKHGSWRVADLNGSMSQRPAWVPYFEGSDAIIFLAPISAFDQYLPEDPTRNRIEDSLRLFKWIVSHPLLATAHIILLLNKSDVLKQKLKTGIRVVRYIPSYGDRPNTVEAVIEFFHSLFTSEFQQSNPSNKSHRSLTVFKSSVVDTVTTRQLIHNIVKKLSEEMMANAFIGVALNKTSTDS